MQAIIAIGNYKEIAALALAMQGRQSQTVRLTVNGKDLWEATTSHLENPDLRGQ